MDINTLIARSETLSADTGLTLSTVSRKILNDGKGLARLKEGGQCTLKTLRAAFERLESLEMSQKNLLPSVSHLDRLEAESIHIMREVASESANPVMLYSVGKDSSVMLHLAEKAFYPSPPPFPLMHVDTTWKFKEMIAFRNRRAKEVGMDLIVHINEEGVKEGVGPFTHGSAVHTDIMKTQSLKQALDKHRFDAAFGGARRDEEKSRAKERIFSFRTANHRWDAKNQRPEIWDIYNTRVQKNESLRVLGYLHAQEKKSFLRFITCGSVDDGKSTLIGRLLYDSKLIYEDQLATIEKDSKKVGTQGNNVDLALLVDGLAAEREQGITIDVAYRFFSTDKRKFIVADTPGHVQYTRNMATGASTADVAILLIDARYGVQEQTRRHSFIVSLLGVKHVVVAINKMDLNGFDQSIYNNIEVEFRDFAKDLGFSDIQFIPMSALDGDNVTTASERAAWYRGPSLLSYLENLEIDDDASRESFHYPVQWVNRPNLDFRGFSGTVVSGSVNVGDEIIVTPSGKRSKVKSIETYEGQHKRAVKSQAVTLTLTDEIDISRGDVISKIDDPALKADQFQAHLLWMNDKALFPGRQYLFKLNNKTVPGSVSTLKYKIDVNDFSENSAKTLNLNEIGVGNIYLSAPVAYAPYKENKSLGSFIIIDKQTNETVGMGMLDYALRRSSNVVWQDLDVNKATRAQQKNQKPALLWFTGLSGSGKSTIANLVEKNLLDLNRHTYTLDGDNVRHGLNQDLGFTKEDRIENIRRIAELSRLMVDAGLITIASFISPYRAERQLARGLVEENEFIEIFVNTPLKVAEARDVKGLYAKARAGKIKNFTGIDSEYQAPQNPEITIDTTKMSAEEAAELIVGYLSDNGFLAAPVSD